MAVPNRKYTFETHLLFLAEFLCTWTNILNLLSAQRQNFSIQILILPPGAAAALARPPLQPIRNQTNTVETFNLILQCKMHNCTHKAHYNCELGITKYLIIIIINLRLFPHLGL